MPTTSLRIPGFELPAHLQRQVLSSYVHRYTGEHVPAWSREAAPNGKYYAPQYETDAEWLNKTVFPARLRHQRLELQQGNHVHCESSSPTFPWGTWLDAPFTKGTPLPTSESSPANQ